LENNLSPSEEDKLAGLVKEYNDELVQQHQEAKLEAERIESVSSAMTQTPLETESSDGKEDPLFLGSQTFKSHEPAADAARSFFNNDSGVSASSSDGTLWYEVVENRVSDGSATPVALYRNEDEAKFCLELKEEFAERHAREKDTGIAMTYIIRKTVK
jgi:hypothetical protein